MAECHKARCIYCWHAKVCMPLHFCERNLMQQKEQSSKGSFMMEVRCLFAHLPKQKKSKRKEKQRSRKQNRGICCVHFRVLGWIYIKRIDQSHHILHLFFYCFNSTFALFSSRFKYVLMIL